MRRLAALVVIGALACAGAAHAETKTGEPKAKDQVTGGVFTPERLKSEAEANAKKLQDSGKGPLPRSRHYNFLWSSESPAEFEALGRHVLFLIAVWTQKGEELPVKSVYLRAGGDTPVIKVSTWKTPVDAGSLTAKMLGPNREDGFYLVPGGALLRKGQLRLDLSANNAGWVLMELPSNVATKDAKRFPNPDPAPNAKPDLKALQALVQRRFTGFPVPASLP